MVGRGGRVRRRVRPAARAVRRAAGTWRQSLNGDRVTASAGLRITVEAFEKRYPKTVEREAVHQVNRLIVGGFTFVL